MIQYARLCILYQEYMDNDIYNNFANLFNILSHPIRLQILDELRCNDACVCHLQTLLGKPQAYVSQQLKILREANIVTDERDGMLVYYRLTNELVQHILEDLLEAPDPKRKLPGCTCPKCQ